MLKNLYRFNRDIVECKGRVDNGFKHGDNTVLIET